MTSRWRLITSSYFRTFLRDSKLSDSTWPWALAMDLVTILASMGWSSGTRSADQHALDPVGLEQPHQVVAQGEVEPGLARVALAAGTTAQLVVDATRLVALGAQHVEPAEVVDLVALGLHLCGDPLQGRRPRRLVLLGVVDRVEAAACAAPGRPGTPPSRRA